MKELQSVCDGRTISHRFPPFHQNETTILLESMAELQRLECSATEPSAFGVFVDSSGTGKTQVAATCARSKKMDTIYFYVGTEVERAQAFYKPHIVLSGILLGYVADFAYAIDKKQFPVPRNENGEFGAVALLRAAESVDYKCNLFSLLNMALFKESWSKDVTLSEIRGKILKSPRYVFLDEVPPLSTRKGSEFWKVILLRDTLRAMGVAPILMSTHTGAENCIPIGEDSRTDQGPLLWARIYTSPPSFQSALKKRSDIATRASLSLLLPTERPLIAKIAVNTLNPACESITNLTRLVSLVKTELQKTKRNAWLSSPLFQLCQLFRSREDQESEADSCHKLVGTHFGHLVRPDAGTTVHSDIGRDGVKEWLKNCKVRMADASKEPILFLALTTWNLDDIGNNSTPMFPLVNNSQEAISVRNVFESNRDSFESAVTTLNPVAYKLCGDSLEVLALASVTLATLQCVPEVFSGVPLPTFLASVVHFMGTAKILDRPKIEATAAKVKAILSHCNSAVRSTVLPACAASDSEFPAAFCALSQNIGVLRRPPDQERRDGYIKDMAGKQVVHIECKNLKDGLDTTIFKKVVERMRENCKLSLLFASSMNNMFIKGSWDDFATELNLPPGKNICFLVLGEDVEPEWLEVGPKKSRRVLGPTTNAVDQYLVAIIVSGAIATRKRVHPPS